MYIYLYIYTYTYIYAIFKTMCPPGHHHNGFMATHALEMCGYTLLASITKESSAI